MSSFYGSVINQPYFSEQRHLNFSEVEGANWIKACCKDIMFVYAPIRSLRQQMQRGRYILFPNHIGPYLNTEEYCFETRIDAIPKDHEAVMERITIPKDVKDQMLSDLAVLGVSRDALFADNVDTVCEGVVEACRQRISGTGPHG